MKSLIVSLVILMTVAAHAQKSDVAFECKSVISVDKDESINIEIKVLEQSGKLASYLVGSGEPGPLATTQQIVSLHTALKTGGIEQILKATGLESSSISSVVIYTAGKFDEDAAGVRTAEFQDSHGQVVGSGMFFGWAGAAACK